LQALGVLPATEPTEPTRPSATEPTAE